ncbi:MAG: hypothetical protein M3488_03840, partial [Actinomycetota bacterium]|nr:hypothetical protein [Actinomycetota bacterium]
MSIEPKSKTTIDDYEFAIPSGLAGGVVSVARELKHTPHEPSVILLAGYEPGTHVLQVIEKATSIIVIEVKYRLTT